MPTNEEANPRRSYALKRCDELVDWYTRARRRSRIWYYSLQSAIILLGGISPMLILALPEKRYDVLKATPPAVAAVLAGLVTLFQFHDQWIRRSVTAEALKSERVKFTARAGASYGSTMKEDAAIENFVLAIEGISSNSVSQWQQQRVDPPSSDNDVA